MGILQTSGKTVTLAPPNSYKQGSSYFTSFHTNKDRRKDKTQTSPFPSIPFPS